MAYTYGIKQIGSLINDIVEDLTGQSAAIQTLDTSHHLVKQLQTQT